MRFHFNRMPQRFRRFLERGGRHERMRDAGRARGDADQEFLSFRRSSLRRGRGRLLRGGVLFGGHFRERLFNDDFGFANRVAG